MEHAYNKSKVVMTPGMVFTIEPILVEGGRRISVWEDGWTAVTFDGGRCVGRIYSILTDALKSNEVSHRISVLFFLLFRTYLSGLRNLNTKC